MAPSIISTFIYTIMFLTTLSPGIEGSPCFSCAVAGVGSAAPLPAGEQTNQVKKKSVILVCLSFGSTFFIVGGVLLCQGII